ncbi:gamma-glutamyltransferase [Emcibacter nanhaiensis]|uniref:Glutathione hydrolase proenzyme n=1 Tax=Emcibacter nanhaiensis TaxID=1505037 RepID=A0A501PCD1_9PROT|nr:gamma-glutamyltransferase [Emcibacter nanhaiensis]TPD57848.1 gamma-glutamyltransferase [Emcibacter nanhaiensis]
MKRLFVALLLICLPFAAGAESGPKTDTGRKHMVVAANPHAAAAGMEMLKAGGSAVDAAIAAELVLTLVEPQSSGIGGGGFMMYYDPEEGPGEGKGGRVYAFDGRETAPAADDFNLFADVERSYQGFLDAVLGGRSTGTPSMLALMDMAHKKAGKLPWKKLFEPAIRLADKGFRVSPRLHYLIDQDPLLKKFEASRNYFYDKDGKARPTGYLLKNPELAATLRLLADRGADAFYHGPLAEKIVKAVQTAKHNPGQLTLEDMAAYRPKIREAVCRPYRAYKVCGMPPPSSGGATVLAILGILQNFDMGDMTPNSPEAMHLLLEAEKLSYADRDLYMADPDFVFVPTEGLTDPDYLRNRARDISPDKTVGTATAGRPPMPVQVAYGEGMTPELPSTSHFSIVDQWGHAVSMTATVENVFGNRMMVGGFILNNQLTDFSFIPFTRDGLPVANRVEGGKRPRSSMSPTLVFDDQDRLVMAIGSPGGNSIIGYVTQTIVNVLDWGMSLQQAVSQPHVLTRNGPVYLERTTAAEQLAPALRAKGHEISIRTTNSGLHGFIVHYDEQGALYEGGADPRREGVTLAE